MDPKAFDPRQFSGTVPVFPLPNVVLYPGTFLPLHIFEPRYREMTRDALAGERLVAMALLRPGWEDQYAGSPPIHSILGLGKIVEDAKLADGRFNLVLWGLRRIRVIEEIHQTPYRRARVELLEERAADPDRYERKRRTLMAFYAQVVREISKGSVAAPPEDVPLGLLCDLLASLISFEPPVKQELLEQLDVAARCDRLMDLLQGLEGGGQGRPQRPWPPGPSLN